MDNLPIEVMHIILSYLPLLEKYKLAALMNKRINYILTEHLSLPISPLYFTVLIPLFRPGNYVSPRSVFSVELTKDGIQIVEFAAGLRYSSGPESSTSTQHVDSFFSRWMEFSSRLIPYDHTCKLYLSNRLNIYAINIGKDISFVNNDPFYYDANDCTYKSGIYKRLRILPTSIRINNEFCRVLKNMSIKSVTSISVKQNCSPYLINHVNYFACKSKDVFSPFYSL